MAPLFSPKAKMVSCDSPPGAAELLWPQERHHIEGAAQGRVDDFVAGRWCAHRALEALGERPVAIGVGERRQPLWPKTVVGAITHTKGLAAAVVAYRHDLASVGIDVEPDLPLPPKVDHRIIRPEEMDQLTKAPGNGLANPDRVIFSAKESIYKAWYPLAQRWLGFEDAIVEFQTNENTFHATILVDGPLSVVNGRYRIRNGFVITSVEVPSG